MPETTLQVTQGCFQILRFPSAKNEKLQAWDAADEYLLQDVAEKLDVNDQPSVLILNDSFGGGFKCI